MMFRHWACSVTSGHQQQQQKDTKLVKGLSVFPHLSHRAQLLIRSPACSSLTHSLPYPAQGHRACQTLTPNPDSKAHAQKHFLSRLHFMVACGYLKHIIALLSPPRSSGLGCFNSLKGVLECVQLVPQSRD